MPFENTMAANDAANVAQYKTLHPPFRILAVFAGGCKYIWLVYSPDTFVQNTCYSYYHVYLAEAKFIRPVLVQPL